MISRNRQSLFWALAFPLIFVVVFGTFFGESDTATTIAVIDNAQDDVSRQLISNLRELEDLNVEERENERLARKEFNDGDLNYLLIIPEGLQATVQNDPPARVTVVYDDTNPIGEIVVGLVDRFIDQANLEMSNAPIRLALTIEGVSIREVDYLDFVLPGLAVWGVMSFSVIGLAATISSYREKKILTRILATPLSVSIFFASQVLAYLVLALIQATIILSVGVLAFGASVEGNLLVIALLLLMGNLVFLNLGFIVGAYAKTVQAASGLGNAVVLPLMFFSGVFFPTDNLPLVLQTLVEFLPLAPMLETFRGVILESKSLTDFPAQLSVLAGWLVGTAIVAVKTFRFR
ncbi:MAG: ABC transporter permease [Chloroflexi bacterium]|nr:ABC transporter permease [Chloroflexota bacterium]